MPRASSISLYTFLHKFERNVPRFYRFNGCLGAWTDIIWFCGWSLFLELGLWWRKPMLVEQLSCYPKISLSPFLVSVNIYQPMQNYPSQKHQCTKLYTVVRSMTPYSLSIGYFSNTTTILPPKNEFKYHRVNYTHFAKNWMNEVVSCFSSTTKNNIYISADRN